MVPRRAAEPRLEPLALPLSAGRVPLRRPRRGERPARQARPRVRAARHGAFDDDRYWIVEVDYAKADPHDVLMTVRVTNVGPEAETLHVLPTAWYRNTWSWEARRRAAAGAARLDGAARLVTEHPFLGPLELVAEGEPRACCSARTRPTASGCSACAVAAARRRTGSTTTSSRAPNGRAAERRDEGRVLVPARRRARRDRRRARCACARPAGAADSVGGLRRGRRPSASSEADEFYAELTPAASSDDEALVMRQALAGMLWSKQLYYYDVARWLDGDPTQPRRRRRGSAAATSGWRTFDAFDIMSMPDKWEYPWFAAWDLAFHCVALAHVDPAFAKYQLILLCREWFQHPNGALPRTSGRSTTSTRRCRRGRRSRCSRSTAGATRLPQPDLRQAAGQLHLVGQPPGQRRLQPLRGRLPRASTTSGRSTARTCPTGWLLEQSDGTGWMGVLRAEHGGDGDDPQRPEPAGDRSRPQVPRALRADLRGARGAGPVGRGATASSTTGCACPTATTMPMKVRSIVGVLPLLARRRRSTRSRRAGARSSNKRRRRARRSTRAAAARSAATPGNRRSLLGVVGVDARPAGARRSSSTRASSSRPTACVRSRATTWSIRSCSTSTGMQLVDRLRARRVDDGHVRRQLELARADLDAGQLPRGRSAHPLRPVLRRRLKVEYPTGSGHQLTLEEIAADLRAG